MLNVYILHHQGVKRAHKFSYGTAFYALNGKNVNDMLESIFRKFQKQEKDSQKHFCFG